MRGNDLTHTSLLCPKGAWSDAQFLRLPGNQFAQVLPRFRVWASNFGLRVQDLKLRACEDFGLFWGFVAENSGLRVRPQGLE